MKSSIKINSAKLFIMGFALFSISAFGQLKNITVDSYDKVIVSPHIAVTFVKGDQESVTIHTSTEPLEKLTVEVVSKTLRLYLEGAKTYTDNEKVKGDQYEYNNPIYKGTVIIATVTYNLLNELSLRGEEKFTCETILSAENFTLKIFGESQVYFNEVDFDNLKTTIYGESYLEFKKGRATKQKITAYGETTINTLGVETRTTKITVFGEGSYRIAVEDRLKVTAFGEATIAYKGSPEVSKGMVLGEARIQKID